MTARAVHTMLGRIHRVLARYTDLTGWIWRDALLRYRGAVLLVVILGGLGLVAEVAGYGTLFAYAHALEKDRVVEWAGMVVTVRQSFAALLVAAAVTFICFVVSAVSNYFAAQRTLGLWQRYERFCIKRVAVEASRLPHPARPRASAQLSRNLVKTLEGDTRYCGRFMQLALNGILPLGRLVVSAGILLAIDWLFTLIVFALVGITQLYLHRINVANVAATRSYEALRAGTKDRQKRLLDHVWKNVVPVGYDDFLVSATYDDGEYGQSLEAYLTRWLAKEKTTLAVSLLGAVTMLVILLIAGVGFLSGQWSWSILLIYVAGLRYFLGSLMNVSSMATSASRYYPHLKRYYTFMDDARAAPSVAVTAHERQPVVLDLPSLAGDATCVPLAPGQPVVLVHPRGIDRDLLLTLYEKTASFPGASQLPFWIVGEGDFQGGTLREYAGMPRDRSPDDVRAVREGLTGGGTSSPVNPDVPLTEEAFAALPPETVERWQLAAALLSGSPVIVLSGKRTDSYWNVRCLRRRFPDRVFLEVVKKVPEETPKEHAVVLFSDGRTLDAWATWAYLGAHPEVWACYLEARNQRAEETPDPDDLDDDDE